MRYGYLYSRKHVTMRCILESYQCDKALKNYYSELIETDEAGINAAFLKKDFIRVNGNIEFVEKRMDRLPDSERELLQNVYLQHTSIPIKELQKKFGATFQDCYKKIRKAIVKFAEIDESGYD